MTLGEGKEVTLCCPLSIEGETEVTRDPAQPLLGDYPPGGGGAISLNSGFPSDGEGRRGHGSGVNKSPGTGGFVLFPLLDRKLLEGRH